MSNAPRRTLQLRLFERGFLRAIFTNLGTSRGQRSALARRIVEDALHTWHGQNPIGDDAQTHDHRWSVCLLIGAERVLRAAGVAKAERRHALERGLVEPSRRSIHFFTRLMLRFSRDPFATLTRYSVERVPAGYGARFEFENLVYSEDTLVQGVRRCFFHDLLRAEDEPELTALFCAYDMNWIRAIDPARDGIEFDRPTTIAAGAELCRFEFRRRSRQGNTAAPTSDVPDRRT